MNYHMMILYINSLSIDYNLDKKTIMKKFLNYIMTDHIDDVNNELLLFIENLLHDNTIDTETFIDFLILKLKK